MNEDNNSEVESYRNIAAESKNHARRLRQRIRRMIADSGPLTFAQFMQQALYAPGLGYYVAGLSRFGAGGDFITAPEISPLFGQCIARQVAQVLAALPAGSEVLEFGPGTGRLAVDVLRELQALGELPQHYSLMEVSADLRARQRQLIASEIPHLVERVRWLERPPSGLQGVVLANEVLDAIPVHRFKVTESGPRELFVDWRDDGFAWRALPWSTTEVGQSVDELCGRLPWPLPDGYETEIAPWREAFAREIGGVLGRGVALLIDYGYPESDYYHPDRAGGTLQCRRHQVASHDPFVNVGSTDLSAHVEFSALARAAVTAGLEVAGFAAQSEFLMALGVLDPLAAMTPGTAEFIDHAQAVKTLTLPSEMGELVKVLALSRGVDIPLSGFTGRDRRPWLG